MVSTPVFYRISKSGGMDWLDPGMGLGFVLSQIESGQDSFGLSRLPVNQRVEIG